MNLNLRTLGLIGMAGSPFLAIDFILGYLNPGHFQTPLSSVLGFLYMIGWLCSIIGLYKLRAAGEGFFGNRVLILQLVFLTLAQLWNLYHTVDPMANTFLFHLLDKFWPGSNIFMIITGIAVLRAGKLTGWKKYIPFIVGLWLPLSYLAMLVPSQLFAFSFSSLYSAITWLLMGLAVSRGSTGYAHSYAFQKAA